MTSRADLFAVLAAFDTPERLVRAIRDIRARGYSKVDAFTPFPVEGLSEALGFKDRRIAAATLVGGIVGGTGGFLMQVATNLDYPLWIGGRPLIALPAFMMITFELTVLGAVLAGLAAMFLSNRLPRLNHPIFSVRGFDLSADDRFYLALFVGEGFDRDVAGIALAALEPDAIIDVTRSTGP